jgi:hypothetical protein
MTDTSGSPANSETAMIELSNLFGRAAEEAG